MNPRRNGELPSYPVPIWNGILEHYERMGSAIWAFVWCIDRITTEEDGVGLVAGGAPVKSSDVAAALRADERTARRQLDHLEEQGYITRERTAHGYIIRVLNSQKRGIWKKRPDTFVQSLPERPDKNVHETGQKRPGDRTKTSGRWTKMSDAYKEYTAVNTAVDAAGVPATAAENLNPWKPLGSNLPMGSVRFQELWGHYFATRNGHLLSEAMERCIQACEPRGVKVPPPFFEAKRRVEAQEQRGPTNDELEIVRLPSAPPFQTKQVPS